MALGWVRSLFGDRVQAFSAGSQPAERVHPLAVQVMAEAGIDIGGERPADMNNFLDQRFDRVITVCDSAAEVCPVFPGEYERIHADFTDPAAADGSDAEKLVVFRRVRDEIRQFIERSFA